MNDQPVQPREATAGGAPGELRRRFRLQFSLLSLLLLVALAASLFALLRDTRAWVPGMVFKPGEQEPGFTWGPILADEGHRVLITMGRNVRETEKTLLIDTDTGRRLAEHKTAPDEPGGFMPDGRYLTTSKEPPFMRISCPGKTGDAIEINGFTGHIVRIRASLNGNRILVVSSDGTAGVWNSITGRKQCDLDTRRFGFASEEVRESAEISSTGQHVAACEQNQESIQRTCTWNAITGALTVDVSHAHHTGQSTFQFVLGGTGVLLNTGDNILGVFDANTARLVASWQAPEGWAGVQAGAGDLSPDGSRLFFYDPQESWEWNLQSGETRRNPLRDLEFTPGEVAIIPYVRYSPDNRRVISAASLMTPNLGIWDTETGHLLAILSQDSDGGKGMCSPFSPDGRRIAVVHADGALRVWHRRRPEAWWGIVALPELWAALISGAALVASLLRNRTRKSFPPPPSQG